MPIDARIPLMGQYPEIRPPDVIGALERAEGLNQARRQGTLADLQLRSAQRADTEQQMLRDAYRRSVEPDAQGVPQLNEQRLLSEYGKVNPEKAMSLGMQLRKGRMEARKTAAETEKIQYETIHKQTSLVNQVAGAILQADTQEAYLQGVATLQRYGIPTEHLPPTYDRRLVQYYFAESQDAAQGLEEARLAQQAQQAREQQATTRRGQDMTAQTAREQPQRDAEAFRLTLPGRVQIARETQAEGLIAAGQKTYEAAVSKPLEGEARTKVNLMIQGEEVLRALATEFTPTEREAYVGLMGQKLRGKRVGQMLQEMQGQTADPKLGRFMALLAMSQAEAFSTGGKALTETEKSIVFGYLPTGQEWSSAEFEQKLALSLERLPSLIDREMALATTSARDLSAQRQATRPSGPPGQSGPPAVTEADIQTTMRSSQRTRAEVVNALRAKGYQVP